MSAPTPGIECRLCPVPGCAAPLRLGHLMCKPCWGSVPRVEQAAVNQTWTAVRSGVRQAARTGDIASYRAIVEQYRTAAEAAVASAERARP
jgi:hypothetical protein